MNSRNTPYGYTTVLCVLALAKCYKTKCFEGKDGTIVDEDALCYDRKSMTHKHPHNVQANIPYFACFLTGSFH